jgi:hypothetical protein
VEAHCEPCVAENYHVSKKFLECFQHVISVDAVKQRPKKVIVGILVQSLIIAEGVSSVTNL